MLDDELKPIAIDPKLLTAEVLESILEEYILREGTDYGTVDISLAQKTMQLNKQVNLGDIIIVFDPQSESVTLMTKNEFKRQTNDV